MNKTLRAYAWLLLPAALIIALDQYTKWLVRSNLNYLEMWSPWPWLMPYVRLVHTHNTGAAFGMFQGFNVFFMLLAVVVSLVIVYYFPQVEQKDWPLRVAMVFQFSGATGNLIDRLHQGYVTDFISVGSFAVFNVADASISTGVVVLIVGMLWHEANERRRLRQPGAAQPGGETFATPEELAALEPALLAVDASGVEPTADSPQPPAATE